MEEETALPVRESRLPDRSTEPAPTRIGRYQVLSCLGRGASGQVFVCYDPVLERPLARRRVSRPGREQIEGGTGLRPLGRRA